MKYFQESCQTNLGFQRQILINPQNFRNPFTIYVKLIKKLLKIVSEINFFDVENVEQPGKISRICFSLNSTVINSLKFTFPLKLLKSVFLATSAQPEQVMRRDVKFVDEFQLKKKPNKFSLRSENRRKSIKAMF